MQDKSEYRQILIDLRRIIRSIDLESKRIQKDLGLSIPQLLCLNYLSECPEFMTTHRQLTAFLHLNSSTVTGIVNRLEKKGLLARLPNREDKRVTNIALTSAGNQLLDSSPDLLHEKLSDNLSRLPEPDLIMVRKALEVLVGVLEIKEVDASPLITIEEPIKPED